METNIVQYLPDWFRSILDYQELTGAETVEFGNFAELMSRVHDDMFVLTADESTVQDWEKIFGIVANPSVETLEFRRARILNRLTFNPPFTLEFLYERLDALIGVGKWAVVVDYANYTLYVEAAATNQAWAGEVLATVSTIKPCHLLRADGQRGGTDDHGRPQNHADSSAGKHGRGGAAAHRRGLRCDFCTRRLCGVQRGRQTVCTRPGGRSRADQQLHGQYCGEEVSGDGNSKDDDGRGWS